MQTSLTLLVVTCLAAPSIAGAQTGLASAPVPEPRPPLRLFTDTLPESSRRSIDALKSSSWYEPPTGNNEIPRWQIGHTVTGNVPGGFALSAGFFARRADPLPLFLAEGVSRDTLRTTSNSVTDPATHRVRMDAKLGISKLLRDGPQLKVNAIGELFIPLKSPDSAAPAFLSSRAFRLAIKTAF
jgi:hypothetical protein